MTEFCHSCNAVVHWTFHRCPVCNQDAGAPNVREVDSSQEKDALEQRYVDAIADAKGRDAKDALEQFADHVAEHSQAVINMPPSFCADFLDRPNTIMSNYVLQVEGETRYAASMNDDRKRRSTEGLLFGAIAEHIRYAALSLDGEGLVSYGACSVCLANETMRRKATVLEENSYTFVLTHNLRTVDPIPQGYRATWATRGKLTATKLAHRIHATTSETSYARLLLYSEGDRATDEFLEVHIYGSLDAQSVTKVIIPEIASQHLADQAHLTRIKDRLHHDKKSCEEHNDH